MGQNVFLTQDGQQLGPFNEGRIRTLLLNGEIPLGTLAWRQGCTEWIPAEQMFPAAAARPVAPERKNPGLGLTGFFIAVFSAAAWLVILVATGMAYAGGAMETSPLMIGLGLLLFGGMFANLIGAVFGLIAVLQKGKKKTLSALGLTLNIAELGGVCFLMWLGSAGA